jgi:Leucine-rich repeat (LRR) protein
MNIEQYLNNLDDDIQILVIARQNLTELPDLRRFNKLKELDIVNNNITGILDITSNVTDNLMRLSCFNNQITEIKNLPSKLERLDCSQNLLSKLDNLPSDLKYLNISFNNFSILPNLPNTLKTLHCHNNQLKNISSLPNELHNFTCFNNQIEEIYSLPDSLDFIYCGNNLLKDLPNIPDKLSLLNFDNNQIKRLSMNINPNLTIYCENNPILFDNINECIQFNKFRKTYYVHKYGRRLEKYFLNFIKKRKMDFHNELLYSPDLPFYKQKWNILQNYI